MSEEVKEISILKRNLRLLKRIVLGKKTPPLFLRILCWASMGWSLLMLIVMLGIGGMISVSPSLIGNSFGDLIGELGGKYFLVYAGLHGTALLGTILMYRLKKAGFYVFAVPTLLMPFLHFVMGASQPIDWPIVGFSAVSIGLFALNWRLFSKVEEEA